MNFKRIFKKLNKIAKKYEKGLIQEEPIIWINALDNTIEDCEERWKKFLEGKKKK